ncbi:MAG: ATP-dependent DNA helicase RecQ [Spirochaetales bacterium]|nr:ATP-dependent DNA helicase RecQ [Spirochaetales bacterium]
MKEDPITPPADPLGKAARDHFNIPYLFPYQRLVISNILEAAGAPGYTLLTGENRWTEEPDIVDTRSRQIVILPTGAGKSLCFMLPALLLTGPTMVVFPLLSLIADQSRRMEEAGMKGGVLKGGQSREEQEKVWAGLKRGDIKMVLTNPETALRPEILGKTGEFNFQHLVIDEAHTVSEWGESFRPAYLELGRWVKKSEIPVITAFTATASPLILERIQSLIFPETSPHIISANPDRPNISYRVIPVLSKLQGLEDLLKAPTTAAVSRPVIVFCGSRRATELIALALRKRLHSNEVFFYHAGLSRDEKKRVEEWFFTSDNGILVATCAYGMGVDKSNIRTVIHAYVPSSIEAYLQESGRAGRDRKPSEAVLLFSPEDASRAKKAGNDPAQQRFQALAGMALRPDRCRRSYLLELMGAPETACSGCDVCSGQVRKEARGYREIAGLIRTGPGMYTMPEAVSTLKGLKGPGSFAPPDRLTPGFGALNDWMEEDILEALRNLALAGRLRTGSGRSYKAKKLRVASCDNQLAGGFQEVRKSERIRS